MKCEYCGDPAHVHFCVKPDHISARKWREMSDDERLKATEDNIINRSWLLQHMKFGIGHMLYDGEQMEYFYRNGLFLSRAWKGAGWRWQVGGTDNMWECLHTPTREFVQSLLRALGFPD